MSNKNKEITFEEKIKKIRLIWVLIYISLTFVIIIDFILNSFYFIYPQMKKNTSNGQPISGQLTFGTTLTHNIAQVTTDNFTTLILSIVIYALLLFLIVISSLKGYSFHVNKVTDSFFDDLSIVKSNHSNGIISFAENKEIVINWSSSGYFIIKYNSEEIAYAKSTELYWKILFVRNNIVNNGQ